MSKKEFFAIAEAAGLDVEYIPGAVGRGFDTEVYPFSVTLDAPAGKLFKGTDIHIDCSIRGEPETTATDWRAAVKALKVIVAEGFEDCTDPTCEYCRPEGDE